MRFKFCFDWPKGQMKWFFWNHKVFGNDALYRIGPFNLWVFTNVVQ